jgi:hypothetical protein
MCLSWLLLGSVFPGVTASIALENIQFTHIVPHRHVLTLVAKRVTGKKILTIEGVKGQYADWLFTAKRIVFNTLNHVIQLGEMSINCKNPQVQIHAQSGTMNLQTYNVTIQSASLTHRNMIFTCPKANYDHEGKKITCRQGVMKSIAV